MIITSKLTLEEEKVNKINSLTAIVIINIPVIKYSVNWWNTLHQPANVR